MQHLAANYGVVGQDRRALAMLRQALEIRRETTGTQDEDYASLLDDIGDAQAQLGQLKEAEASLRQAAALYEGKSQSGLAVSLSSLAKVVHQQGDCKQAEVLFVRAMAVADAAREETDSVRAILLRDLAQFRYKHQDFKEAVRLQRKATVLMQAVVGETHPHIAIQIEALARYELAAGNEPESEKLASSIIERFVGQLALASGRDERRQFEVHESLRGSLELWLSLSRRGHITPERAYGALLLWKGNVFAEQRGVRLAREQQPELIPKIDDLERDTTKLSYLWTVGSPADKRAEWQAEVDRLTGRVRVLNDEISLESVDFRRHRQGRELTPARLQELLPRDVLLIDIVEYRDFRPGKEETFQGPPRLAAFLLRHDCADRPARSGPVPPRGG